MVREPTAGAAAGVGGERDTTAAAVPTEAGAFTAAGTMAGAETAVGTAAGAKKAVGIEDGVAAVGCVYVMGGE